MAPGAFITGTPAVGHKTSFTSPATCSKPVVRSVPSSRRGQWTMGKKAKFGPFTPVVVATKYVIGEKNLNKLRGKGIAAHSKVITVFCEKTGAETKTRQNLIRTAKSNGDTLGLLW